MSLAEFKMRDLLEAGVHFGHHPRRWNPKMEKHIFGVRNNVHIINLEHTYPMLRVALNAVKETVAAGGRVLFVGTKRQTADFIAEAAEKTGQFYVNHRWLGGMLTNWKTVSQSIVRLKELEETLDPENPELKNFTKKELLKMSTQCEKLQAVLGGIKEMGGLPDILVVFDVTKEAISVEEAHNLDIPVVGIVDTNGDPNTVDYPVPGNDDARRSVELYCRLFTGAVLDGLQIQMSKAGVDLGGSDDIAESMLAAEAEEVAVEAVESEPEAPAAEVAAEPAPEAQAEAAEAKPETDPEAKS